jgi:hypothetical protein
MGEMSKNLRLDRKATYQIKVQGDASANLTEWLEDASIKLDRPSSGIAVTTLTGTVQDQAGLHGLLNRIHDLNIPLVSLQLIDPKILNVEE